MTVLGKLFNIQLVTVGPFVANGTLQTNLNLPQDSTFKLYGFVATSTTALVTDLTENVFSVLITDSGTGWQFSNIRTPQRLFCGNAFNLKSLPEPIEFAPNTNLLFDFLNLTAGTPTVTLGLWGYKIRI